MNIAIVGATGNVGRKTLEVLEKKELSIDKLYFVASPKSAGKKISFKGKEHEVFDLENFDFSKVKIAFFAAGGKISEKFAEKAAKHCIVIDNSSCFRMDDEVPLIVPEVNPEAINNYKNATNEIFNQLNPNIRVVNPRAQIDNLLNSQNLPIVDEFSFKSALEQKPKILSDYQISTTATFKNEIKDQKCFSLCI